MIQRYIWLNTDENKEIVIDKTGEYAYFFLVAWWNATVKIRIISSKIKVRCSALLVSPVDRDSDDRNQSPQKLKKNATVQFSLVLEASESRADILLTSFLTDNTSSQIDWKVELAPGVENTEWYLTEEVLVLWRGIKVKTSPQLFVGSKNVKASHGASIQRLQPEKLFYMNAKGITPELSRKLFIGSYIHKTMQFVWLEDASLSTHIEEIVGL